MEGKQSEHAFCIDAKAAVFLWLTFMLTLQKWVEVVTKISENKDLRIYVPE